MHDKEDGGLGVCTVDHKKERVASLHNEESPTEVVHTMQGAPLEPHHTYQETPISSDFEPSFTLESPLRRLEE